MKVKSYTGAVVISLHCKHNMLIYISVSHKHTAKHCIISQFHINGSSLLEPLTLTAVAARVREKLVIRNNVTQ